MLTTVIGAFPKPQYLEITDWFAADGGTDTKRPTSKYLEEISKMGKEAESIFMKATEEIINDQIECGIDIITDGEVRRENYIHYHCRHLSGIDFTKLTEKSARTGNYNCWLPTIVDKIEARESFLEFDFLKAQKISTKPIKITIPGPMTISDTVANGYYKSKIQLGNDLAIAINAEIKRLVKAGCKYIQVDEPLFARKPNEALSYGIDNLQKCFEGIDNKEVEKITHICCGYPDKLNAINYPKAPLDSYKKIAEKLDNSIIDSVSIEDAHRYNDLTLLKDYKYTKVIFGLIKIANSKIETVEEIENRIKEVLKFISKEQLVAAPDCGLGHLSRELAIKKLKIMSLAAKKFN